MGYRKEHNGRAEHVVFDEISLLSGMENRNRAYYRGVLNLYSGSLNQSRSLLRPALYN